MQVVVFVQSSITVASISFVFSRGITNLFTQLEFIYTTYRRRIRTKYKPHLTSYDVIVDYYSHFEFTHRRSERFGKTSNLKLSLTEFPEL